MQSSIQSGIHGTQKAAGTGMAAAIGIGGAAGTIGSTRSSNNSIFYLMTWNDTLKHLNLLYVCILLPYLPTFITLSYYLLWLSYALL